VRELQSPEKAPHCMRVLRVLSWQENFRFSEKDGKETEKRESEKSGSKVVPLEAAVANG